MLIITGVERNYEEDLKFEDTGTYSASGGREKGVSTDDGFIKTRVHPGCTTEWKNVNGCHRWRDCDGYMHGFCGTGIVGEEGYGQQRLCGLCG